MSLYSQNRLLFWSGNGRLHSHRLARRRRAFDSFFSPARTNGRAASLRDYKKASFSGLRRSTSEISKGNIIFIHYN